jgi:methylenetetrahydrofolate reductase (NADPH)
MKVIDALCGARRAVSVEIEPPSIGKGIAEIFDLLDPLVEMGIRYIDITYHVEQIVDYVEHHGTLFPVSQRKKPGTAGVAGAIRERYKARGIEPVPHVICYAVMPPGGEMAGRCLLSPHQRDTPTRRDSSNRSRR